MGKYFDGTFTFNWVNLYSVLQQMKLRKSMILQHLDLAKH